MKQLTTVFLTLLFCAISTWTFGQINNLENATSITSDGTAPHASAMLHVQSTDKGVLIPRMTLANINAIVSPATGLMVYRSDGAAGFYYYDGAAWAAMGGVGGDADWTVNGNDVYNETADVGMGTTAPSAPLHIKQLGTGIHDGFRLETSGATNEDWYYYLDGNDDLTISNDNAASNKFIFQKNTGNVAIGGDFAAGYRLSVDGKIATEEVLIDLSTSWPDYVFAAEYDLLTIDEFAQSIETNKHLPGIPSAVEVEENGLTVGDMQIRTMEKVEELSLYIIQLHERIKALESENKTLKSDK